MRSFALAALLLLTLSACGGEASPAPSGDLRWTPGGEYVVTAAAVAGSPHAWVEGSEVRISFDDGKLGITAGCNHLFGDYTYDDGVLTTGPIGGTEMGCPAPLMEQDAWLAAFFAEPVTVDHDPLTLTAGDTVLTLVPRTQVHPDRTLVGVRWVLDGVLAGDSVSSVPRGPDVMLTFESRDVAAVTGLCNGLGADVSVAEDTITWRPGPRTLMACADEARNRLDTDVAALLTGRTAYTITERTLQLTRGDRGLVFRASE